MLPVVDLCKKSAKYHFCVGGATRSMRQRTHGKLSRPAPMFLFDRVDQYNDPKNTSDHTLSEKKGGADFSFVCTCGSNKRLNFQIEPRKIESGHRSVATCPHN